MTRITGVPPGRSVCCALAGIGLMGAGVGPAPLAAEPAFVDITAAAGTGGPTVRDRFGGHGVMFADVDGDGRPDLYITMISGRPMPDLFFRNPGGGAFAEESIRRGLCKPDDVGTHGLVFADLDNDGDYDVFRGRTFQPDGKAVSNQILRNDGKGNFTDVTPACVSSRKEFTRGVLAFDMDGDGALDLFAVSNANGSKDPPEERNEVYRNEGGLKFAPIAKGALADAPAGQGAIDTDFDGDGDVDVVAANRTGPVNILRNDGKGNFERVPPDAIGISHEAHDGISTADVDNDGDLDLLLAGDDEGRLYLNDGHGKFVHAQDFAGTDGYMGGFADLDNDGDLDLVFAGDKVVYLNDGKGHFTAGPTVPVSGINDPRGIAFADIDGDGDLDFAIGVRNAPNRLIRNDLARGRWLKVRLVSPHGQAGAFGAKVRIYAAGEAGKTLLGLREARSSSGYLGQDDPVLHFGLGERESVDIVVTFLGGMTVTRANIPAGKMLMIDGRKGQ